jgi:dienelactone hydrolase
MVHLLSAGFLVFSLVAQGFASDRQRELMFADYLKGRFAGELTWLDAAGQKFIGLYTETERLSNNGAVIVLHDIGEFPDQQPVVSLLRSEFPKHQFASLSLQMPLREAGASSEAYYALFPEAVSRIQAGIDFLTKKDFKVIVLIGYGLGGLMALYAQSEKALAVKALVVISLPVPVSDQKAAQTLEMLKKVKLPLLDIYAESDLASVQGSAREKRVAAKDNPGYRQLKIDHTDHLFRHQTGLLSKRIYSWLSRNLH